MDILSILALSKANKALKNGGGETGGSGIAYYDFTCALENGYYVVTTEATVEAILADISSGKLPIAIIHRTGQMNTLAYVQYFDNDDVEFLTLPSITDQGTYAWLLKYDSHDVMWDFSQQPPSIE